MQYLLKLTGFLRPYPWRVAAAVLLGAGTILAGVGLLATSGYLISEAALQPPILDLMVVIVAVRAFGLSRAALRYGERLVSHDLTFRLLMNLRSWFFRGVSRLPAASIAEQRSGDLLASATSDIDELQNFYVRVWSPVIVAIIVLVATVGFLYAFSPPAAATLGVMLALNGAGVPMLVRRLSRGLGERQVALRSRLHHLWVESCQGMEELRLFGSRQERKTRIGELTEELARLEKKQAWVTGLQDSLSNWMQYAAVFIALLVTAPLVWHGELSGVMVALVLLATMGAFEATQNLGTAFQYMEATEKATNNITSVLEASEEAEEQMPEPPEADAAGGDITFQEVSFGYDERLVLNGVTFSIVSGSKVAVAGPTGSGKSTLVNLLIKFYQPQSGEIQIGEQSLSSIPEEQIRASVSVVDQHTYIFTDTLRNNLLLAAPEASDQKLREILTRAELADWLAQLPEGLDTLLGEHGTSLSGGERQRLALARALLKDAPIWVLDEPTAHLDTVTEHALLQTIREATQAKTLLWITHRLVEMERFDRIVLFREGRVTEQGNHQSLMKQQGMYARMREVQDAYLEIG